MHKRDPEPLVRRNCIIYRCLTPSPAQALLFGNGRLGGSVHTPDDSLYLLISRSDIWNEKGGLGSIAAVRVRGPAGLFTNARPVRQVCDLYEAVIRITADDVTFTLTALRGRDLIVLDIESRQAPLDEFAVTIENWHDGDETTATETVHINRASSFAESNARVKVDAGALGLSDPLMGRSWGLFVRWERQSATRQQVRIAAVCRAPETDGDPAAVVRVAGRSLVAASAREVDGWFDEHRRWWSDFWSRSYLALTSATGDAEYEERAWYANLYYLACAHGGDFPARFNGGVFLLDRDRRGWDEVGYVFQNMRELYWPLLATGHWEWLRDFFQMYFDCAAFTRAQTRQIFGIDALSFREAQCFWGWDCDTDLQRQIFNEAHHCNFDNNLELCLLMDWYCQAAGDDRFLREKCYPLMKEILAFYLAYAKKGEDGRYHLAPANALEVWPEMKDPMTDIAGLRYLLPRLITWGTRFAEAAATLARWREFLEHLAPIPVGFWTIARSKVLHGIHLEEWQLAAQLDPQGLFLPAAGGTHEKMQRRNMENAEFYHVFPFGLLGLDSPAEERRRFEVTWHHRTWKYVNNGWAQDVPQLARMGWAELARTISIEHASYSQRFPNGAFISPDAPHFHGLLTATPYLDAAGVHLTGLNEMLLQSYDGIIRITPAVTVEWSGQFKLHALGGFVVEAAFQHGQPVSALITSARGGRLRVRWGGQLIERDVQAGETCQFGKAITPSPGDDHRPDVIYPGYKIRLPLAAQGSGHWHDERKGHGQIGLAEDGLFPATRTSLP